jgi:hypothetical protein
VSGRFPICRYAAMRGDFLEGVPVRWGVRFNIAMAPVGGYPAGR